MKNPNNDNDFDELEKMLFDYYKTKKQIPKSVQETIAKALYEPYPTRISHFYTIKKIAIIIFFIVSLSSCIIFAKDIINFISSLFKNSTLKIL